MLIKFFLIIAAIIIGILLFFKIIGLYVCYALLFVCFIAWIIQDSRQTEKKISSKMDEIFAGRKPLNDDAFYDTFYGEGDIPKDIIVAIRKILEEYFLCDLACLHKTDTFKDHFKIFFEYDDMASVEIIIFIEHHFSITLSDDEVLMIETFDDLVQAVWKKLKITSLSPKSAL